MLQVQANLLSGSKFNDGTVPTNVGTGELIAARKARLAAEKAESMYTTTNKQTLGKSADEAANLYATGSVGCPNHKSGSFYFV